METRAAEARLLNQHTGRHNCSERDELKWRLLNMRKSLVAFFSLIAFVPGVFAQGGGVQTASVTLTSAQVQHLHASPVQLVASPGAGQFVDVISVAYQYRAGSTPYALSNGGNFPNFRNRLYRSDKQYGCSCRKIHGDGLSISRREPGDHSIKRQWYRMGQ